MLRRPRTEFPEYHDHDHTDDANAGGRIYNLNSSANRFKGDYSSKKNKEDARQIDDTSLRQLADAAVAESKLKTIKLKVGGMTRTIQTKNVQPSDASQPRQNLTPQENSSEDSPLADKKSASKGISWKHGTFGASKGDKGKMPMKNVFEKQGDKPHQNRKSKMVPNRLDEDDDIRYLEKLKSSKVARYKDLGEESTKIRSLLKVDKYENSEDVGRSRKELLSDERTKKKEKQMKESSVETKRETGLTTRQRANQIEFPNGLPPAPPRKQKKKLSEVEQKQKNAEAAQRRRMQNEKAARESEAEALRKIRGQDSNRKKLEEQIKKRQEELAQEKAAKELASNTIRTVMGPTGTVVTFSPDMGLPSIFDSKPCSYPPPREKCAGPSCVNAYKYRDSKSNLPLCSLKCYKAIHEKMQEDEKAC
ncbi:hypothetical protein RND71_015136 [Anisodus tanguticus]|uniref:INO80 complex subunit B-like conserved region domain-containing protein n=1 Tax=Anisodus tanguticus TaxID=243964 RepID=A0AAE1VKI2_9SOLA|nr:hypothetical protein RND71_015136 [Anisodus tanguticus]